MALPMAMKTMKVMKSMKTMKAMKKAKAMKAMRKAMKRASKVAKGKLAKAVVFRGGKEKTSSGLTKAALHKNKKGKIVSKAQTAAGRKAYTHISAWTKACQQARRELKIKGFVPIGGKTAAGRAFLAKVRSLYKK
jgi:hypothetical protein